MEEMRLCKTGLHDGQGLTSRDATTCLHAQNTSPHLLGWTQPSHKGAGRQKPSRDHQAHPQDK